MKKISLLMILALGTFTLFTACKNDAKNAEKETKETMDENAVKGQQPSGAFIVNPIDSKISLR